MWWCKRLRSSFKAWCKWCLRPRMFRTQRRTPWTNTPVNSRLWCWRCRTNVKLYNIWTEQQEESLKDKKTFKKKLPAPSQKSWNLVEVDSDDSEELKTAEASQSSKAMTSNRKSTAMPKATSTEITLGGGSGSIGENITSDRDLVKPIDRLGPQTQRPIFRRGVRDGSRLLELAHSTRRKFDSRATKPDALWSSERSSSQHATILKTVTETDIADNLSSIEQTSMIAQSIRVLDHMFNEYCQDTPVPSHVVPPSQDDPITESILSAERLIREVHSEAVPVRMSCPHQIDLLEVYADPNSPLTDAVIRQGGKAMRFTKQDGDLSTHDGQKKLWQWIDKYQPKEIWTAPECGPWGPWSRFNLARSLATNELITRARESEMCHLNLCLQLCRYQVRRGRHFHFEHPQTSEALHTEPNLWYRFKNWLKWYDLTCVRLVWRFPKRVGSSRKPQTFCQHPQKCGWSYRITHVRKIMNMFLLRDPYKSMVKIKRFPDSAPLIVEVLFNRSPKQLHRDIRKIPEPMLSGLMMQSI